MSEKPGKLLASVISEIILISVDQEISHKEGGFRNIHEITTQNGLGVDRNLVFTYGRFYLPVWVPND